VTFGEPVAFDGGDRKSIVRLIEQTVRQMRNEALRGALTVKAA
jgi:hypothetical protein